MTVCPRVRTSSRSTDDEESCRPLSSCEMIWVICNRLLSRLSPKKVLHQGGKPPTARQNRFDICKIMPCGTLCLGFGPVWSGLVRFGLVWSALVRFG